MQPLDLPHRLERTVLINAKPSTVFAFLTETPHWAAWWGAGSTIDPIAGGKIYIRHANGVESLGQVLELDPPQRIVFSYGFASGKPIPPGSSRVTIHLEPHESGTRLHLLHEFADAGARDEHVQGWRFQLSLFSNLVTNEVFAGAANTVDAWFKAWVTEDAPTRDEMLAAIASPTIRFRDRFSLLDGIADLSAHIAASHRFMPGVALQRKGEIRHCQGVVLADWVAARDGKELMTGTSVFTFGPDGKIDSVTGFTNK